jgi:hypothetical protein
MTKYKRYTKDQLTEAVKTSFSLAQVLTKLGLAKSGDGYITLRRNIRDLSLDTSHFVGQRKHKQEYRWFSTARSIERYLSNAQPVRSTPLKERLIKDGILKHQCSRCLNTEWQGGPMPLQLHHKDGNPKNNQFVNLCLLCPNCHTLTPNYCGRKLITTTS